MIVINIVLPADPTALQCLICVQGSQCRPSYVHQRGSRHPPCEHACLSYICNAKSASPYIQHCSFYDFIINKARGKSGPLFSFDVHDDVRLVGDASLEKDEVRSPDYVYSESIPVNETKWPM